MLVLEALKDLYGKPVISYTLSFTQKTGLVIDRRVGKVDELRSGVSPARGCDVIINGASCRSERIFRVEPNVAARTQVCTLTGTLEVKLYGSCETEEEMEIILEAFKKTVRGETKSYVDRLKQDISELNSAFVAMI
jgi:hypothetical protein